MILVGTALNATKAAMSLALRLLPKTLPRRSTKTLTTLRKIKPDLKRIAVQVKKESIPVTLIYGRHDRIILPHRGYRFQEAVGPTCSLHIIESGHQVLHEKHISALLPLLLP